MDDQYYRKAKPKFKLPGALKKVLGNKTLLLTLLIVLPIASFITFSNRGIVARLALESDKEMMLEKIRVAQQEQARLQKLSKDLDTDMKAIEKVAREKYGMVREGETVYKVKKEK